MSQCMLCMVLKEATMTMTITSERHKKSEKQDLNTVVRVALKGTHILSAEGTGSC